MLHLILYILVTFAHTKLIRIIISESEYTSYTTQMYAKTRSATHYNPEMNECYIYVYEFHETMRRKYRISRAKRKKNKQLFTYIWQMSNAYGTAESSASFNRIDNAILVTDNKCYWLSMYSTDDLQVSFFSIRWSCE